MRLCVWGTNANAIHTVHVQCAFYRGYSPGSSLHHEKALLLLLLLEKDCLLTCFPPTSISGPPGAGRLQQDTLKAALMACRCAYAASRGSKAADPRSKAPTTAWCSRCGPHAAAAACRGSFLCCMGRACMALHTDPAHATVVTVQLPLLCQPAVFACPVL